MHAQGVVRGTLQQQLLLQDSCLFTGRSLAAAVAEHAYLELPKVLDACCLALDPYLDVTLAPLPPVVTCRSAQAEQYLPLGI